MKWTWVSIAPAVAIRSSPAMTSVPGPIDQVRVDAVHARRGLPALPMPTIRPSLMPMSPLTMPSTGRCTITLVMTRSSAPSACGGRGAWPMPSRIDLPPPKTRLVAVDRARSRSISMIRSVSASRTRSPVVGPYRSAYCWREIDASSCASCVVAVGPRSRASASPPSARSAPSASREAAVDQAVEADSASPPPNSTRSTSRVVAGLEAHRRARRGCRGACRSAARAVEVAARG